MTSLRSLLGRPVVATDTAEQLGSVDTVVVDPAQQRIVALHLGSKSAHFLAWADVNAVGDDAVMAASATAARDPQGPLEERVAAGVGVKPGQRVLDDGGDEFGHVGRHRVRRLHRHRRAPDRR